MNKICINQNNLLILKYILLTFKYVIPIIFTVIGFIKLIIITNKNKAIKRLIKYVLIGLIIFLITFIIEFMLKNKYECILCTMENNCKIKNKNQDINLDENQNNQIVEEKQETETVVKQNKIEIINGVTYIDGVLIVNKTYSLPQNYMPSNAKGYNRCNECLTKETLQAFNEMQTDASIIGLNLYISSGYRSYTYQQGLYNNYVNRDGKQAADTYSARPGHSEHQTGLAFDLNTIDDSFATTAEGKWVQENCYRYGLILRYPKGKEKQTGYQYESWHLRYVGKELAEKLYNNGNWITLEEYFNITSEYE